MCRKLQKQQMSKALKLQSRTKLMADFVYCRKFRVETPPTPTEMLNADKNVIDELTSISSSSIQHSSGRRGELAAKGSSLHAREATFNANFICPNEFCLRL